MLLENIFFASLMLFLFMLFVWSMVSRFNLFAHQRYDNAIMGTLMLSGASSIITAIWWIVRAWG